MIGVSNGQCSAHGQCDRAGHPPIEADKLEFAIGARRCGGQPFQQSSAPIQSRQRPGDCVAHQPSLMREQRHLQAELQHGDSEIETKSTEVAAGRDPGAARNHASNKRQERS